MMIRTLVRPTVPYEERRDQIQRYFDRTALDAWRKLTSTEPVGYIRGTVRAGRDRMRATLLSYLPEDLRGARVLDAGCGTGALAEACAARGAEVVATDVSPALIALARERVTSRAIDFRVSDMLDPELGRFDWIVAMDSLIHYRGPQMVEMVAALAERADRAVLFTFAPRTLLLAIMHFLGRVFPRGSRAPDLEPIAADRLRGMLAAHPALAHARASRSERIDAGFYTSQTMELVKNEG